MGRKKISIQRISDERNRQVRIYQQTFLLLLCKVDWTRTQIYEVFEVSLTKLTFKLLVTIVDLDFLHFSLKKVLKMPA